MKPFGGPNYSENQKECHAGDIPCAYCGKAIKVTSEAPLVFICCDDFQPASTEESHRSHGNNMGGYPMGPDCAARLKKQRPEILEGGGL